MYYFCYRHNLKKLWVSFLRWKEEEQLAWSAGTKIKEFPSWNVTHVFKANIKEIIKLLWFYVLSTFVQFEDESTNCSWTSGQGSAITLLKKCTVFQKAYRDKQALICEGSFKGVSMFCYPFCTLQTIFCNQISQNIRTYEES